MVLEENQISQTTAGNRGSLVAADAAMVRGGKPVILTNCRDGEGLDDVVARLAHDLLMQE